MPQEYVTLDCLVVFGPLILIFNHSVTNGELSKLSTRSIQRFIVSFHPIAGEMILFDIMAWNPKQPFINGCFNWMIPNLYIGNGCFTKHLFINGCLGFQGASTEKQTSAFQPKDVQLDTVDSEIEKG